MKVMMQKLNVVKYAVSAEQKAELESKGFKEIKTGNGRKGSEGKSENKDNGVKLGDENA